MLSLTPKTQSAQTAVPALAPFPQHPPLERKVVGTIQILNSLDWLPSILNLHEQVRSQLPVGCAPVLVPKSAGYFSDLLLGKTGLLLGVFIDDELAGITAVVWSNTFKTAHKAGILTCPDTDGVLAKIYNKSPIAIIQSVCVQGKYAKNGLCKALISKAVSIAESKGCTDAFAQIAAHNVPSIKLFEKLSFTQICKWTSGHDRVLVHVEL